MAAFPVLRVPLWLTSQPNSAHNWRMNTSLQDPNVRHAVDPTLLRPKRGLRAWLFAKTMAQADKVHDVLIAPYKERLLTNLHGDVLEIGPGDGPNFRYFAPDVRWVGVEPNPYMHDYLRATAAAQGRTVDLRIGFTEVLPAADASMDAVVSTLVLCSVGDLQAGLAEIRRVLKPGGKYVFIEHVAAPRGSGARRLQNWVRPLWGALADGCEPNREIWRYLEDAGFSQLEIEHFRINVPIIKPHIAGYAVK